MSRLRLLAIAMLIPFGALSVYALQQVGFVGVLEYQFANSGGIQVWVDLLIAMVLFVAGLAVVGIAAFGLGRALTPTPVPTKAGMLTTTGMYRWVRHPIYTGVLLVVAGLTLRSGNVLTLVIAAATVAFFDRNAAWEERQLRRRYRDYDGYAAITPRFIPGTRPRRRR